MHHRRGAGREKGWRAKPGWAWLALFGLGFHDRWNGFLCVGGPPAQPRLEIPPPPPPPASSSLFPLPGETACYSWNTILADPPAIARSQLLIAGAQCKLCRAAARHTLFCVDGASFSSTQSCESLCTTREFRTVISIMQSSPCGDYWATGRRVGVFSNCGWQPRSLLVENSEGRRIRECHECLRELGMVPDGLSTHSYTKNPRPDRTAARPVATACECCPAAFTSSRRQSAFQFIHREPVRALA